MLRDHLSCEDGSVDFFAHHLDQAAATPPVLAGPSGAYPELTFGPP